MVLPTRCKSVNFLERDIKISIKFSRDQKHPDRHCKDAKKARPCRCLSRGHSSPADAAENLQISAANPGP